ncbi:NADPH-dependent FMN reductase [Yeosuana sp.]|mgnify:CR=1 FL=1|uniref:NADPH-dependent FMN reductase n=1 Tax=Yeosuana sp. TaxID=2529388 RepID=UPI00405533FE|tara:strand:- start:2360 stop:2890 length:531 start_codon:yes stop_codon:yes gene_type:complete
MKNIIAFAGSNSSDSINKKLAIYAANLVEEAKVTILDLNNFELPIYSKDLEAQEGIPDNAKKFLNYIKQTDGIVLSLAENNGAYSAVFKNLFDWMSRIDGKLWSNKPMLLMATSPGSRGGASVLEMAKKRFPFNGGHIVSEFSLPNFDENFKEDKIVVSELNSELLKAVKNFQNTL